MKRQARDLLILIDASARRMEAIQNLIFVPPLRVLHHTTATHPETTEEEPLLYLLGEVAGLSGTQELLDWMDRLHQVDGAPVALWLPRSGYEWSPAVNHPQFCGLLPGEPELPIEAMERILSEARHSLASRWGHGAIRRARLAWSFSTREASDPEQAWLLLETALSGLIGSSADLSCLGMAFSEALTNAVEHGNLELDSSLKDRPDDGILRFFEERERRLRDARYSRRRVRVTAQLRGRRIQVRIWNEGQSLEGGRIVPIQPAAMAQEPVHGRGLSMIESLVDKVSISDDGHSIVLTHRVPAPRIRPAGNVPSLIPDGDERRSAA